LKTLPGFSKHKPEARLYILTKIIGKILQEKLKSNRNCLQTKKIFIDSKKIYAFIPRKNRAGKIAKKPSLTLSLAATPRNIIRASPPDDSIKK
jgi:hypothetical protein